MDQAPREFWVGDAISRSLAFRAVSLSVSTQSTRVRLGSFGMSFHKDALSFQLYR